MTTTPIYKTWQKRIDSGVFTKSQCSQWAHAVVPISNGEMATGRKTNLTQEEAGWLLESLKAQAGVTLTPEHTAQGLDWLEKYAAKRLPNLPADWLARFSHFRFMGDALSYGNGYYNRYIPIWRIIFNDGEIWDYCAMAWQTGRSDEAWQVRWSSEVTV